MLNRRAFCRSAMFGAAGVLAGCGGAYVAAKKKRPNILLVTTDDQGVHAGCYGDPYARTPNLDKMAAEGVRFTRAYVTQASCSPSRSSIFTGLYPHQNGQIGLAHRGYSMHEGIPTMPAVLKAAGYRTGVIGKVHVGPKEALPFDWFGGVTTPGTRRVKLVADRAEIFLRETGDAPFFLMVNYFDPHRPLADQSDGVPERPLQPEEVKPFPFLGLDTPKVRGEVAAYYNCVERADAGLGLLLDLLERTGKASNTLVVYLGDHGAPFTRSKTTCYEAGVQVPFVVRWPGRTAAGRANDGFASTVDLLPTVAEAAGLDLPAPVAGRSLVPLLEGRTVEWRSTLCTEYTSHGRKNYFPRRAIRDDRFKLILNLTPERGNPVGGVDGCAAWQASRDSALEGTKIREVYDTYRNPPPVELYDLENDPYEFENLAGKAESAEVEAGLMAQLEAWRKETEDPLLDPEALATLTREHGDTK
ncbi:MAG: sulfatase [bacterium]|nr:sulfatase [bacterium]